MVVMPNSCCYLQQEKVRGIALLIQNIFSIGSKFIYRRENNDNVYITHHKDNDATVKQVIKEQRKPLRGQFYETVRDTFYG
jgi:hypothetical protein